MSKITWLYPIINNDGGSVSSPRPKITWLYPITGNDSNSGGGGSSTAQITIQKNGSQVIDTDTINFNVPNLSRVQDSGSKAFVALNRMISQRTNATTINFKPTGGDFADIFILNTTTGLTNCDFYLDDVLMFFDHTAVTIKNVNYNSVTIITANGSLGQNYIDETHTSIVLNSGDFITLAKGSSATNWYIIG